MTLDTYKCRNTTDFLPTFERGNGKERDGGYDGSEIVKIVVICRETTVSQVAAHILPVGDTAM